MTVNTTPTNKTSHNGWTTLHVPAEELQLRFTLPTGQSFRWRCTGDAEYTGVIQGRVVTLRQQGDTISYKVRGRIDAAKPADDAAIITDYLNLDAVCLKEHSTHWASRDTRFAAVKPYIQGARVLRQPPLECLLSFVCSSNNHISRIAGMVERLCARYGSPIDVCDDDNDDDDNDAANEEGSKVKESEITLKGDPSSDTSSTTLVGDDTTAAAVLGKAEAGAQGAGAPSPPQGAPGIMGLKEVYYAFPTLQQLARATEEELYADGFGYRARFIVGSINLLLQPDKGEPWLMSLRAAPYQEALTALQQLPGVGPKVAACVCLFSLDKHQAVPVDTHVWQLACRYYAPHLKGRSLTPKLMGQVEGALQEVFGSHAGWAHNTLFIAELASSRDALPEHLQPRTPGGGGKRRRGVSSESSGGEEDSD